MNKFLTPLKLQQISTYGDVVSEKTIHVNVIPLCENDLFKRIFCPEQFGFSEEKEYVLSLEDDLDIVELFVHVLEASGRYFIRDEEIEHKIHSLISAHANTSVTNEYDRYYTMHNPSTAYRYARDNIKGRWYEVEQYILEAPGWAALYARDVIKGRWLEAEPGIMKLALPAVGYATDVIKRRWLEAERYIREKDTCWKYYESKFNTQEVY